MSRLIVKNLPSKIKEAQLRAQFEAYGTVTDCSLKYHEDGSFRNFAFIGFKLDCEAAMAMKRLNQTFINSAKIEVCLANDLSIANVGHKTSKQAKPATIDIQQKNAEIIQKEVVEVVALEEQPQSSEEQPLSDQAFLKLMTSTKLDNDSSDDSSSSDDDDDDDSDSVLAKTSHSVNEEADKGNSFGSFKIVMRGLPSNVKEPQIREFFKPIPLTLVAIPKNARRKKSTCVVTVAVASEADRNAALRRNKNYMGSKRIFLNATHNDPESDKKDAIITRRNQDKEGPEINLIAETSRLFVRNLAHCCTEEDLLTLFAEYGPSEVHLPIDRIKKTLTGIAFVSFELPENAVRALNNLDGTIFQGRMLHLLPGKAKKNQVVITDDISFAKKKELLKKSTASSSHNWNTLFVGANAVADVMAKKYNVSKSDILLKDGKQSAAVKLALGEVCIVSEIKEFLLANDVALDSFSQPAGPRSKTTILVKHLPAFTCAADLQPVFERYGVLGRLILPPSGLTAVVEYIHPTEAKAAFSGLAYSKFQHIPLYLEWAPMNVFTKPNLKTEETTSEESSETSTATATSTKTAAPTTKSTETAAGTKTSTKTAAAAATSTEKTAAAISSTETTATTTPKAEKVEAAEPDSESDDQIQEGGTIFVKNLNFSTTEEAIREKFNKYGKICEVTIARKHDPKKKGELLSQGFGFVAYKTAASAQEAIRQLQNSMLDDHRIELKVSNRTMRKCESRRKQEGIKKQNNSTKILIRNIPFEATRAEIQQLFGTFGEIKSVRIPTKLQGAHRGFGFVDYLSKEDAKAAFSQLQGNHLYKRSLALEWADAEETVESLRRKTTINYSDDGSRAKRKKSELLADLE